MKRARPRSRHGLNVLKARVKVRGLQAIDRRTAAARALLAWRKELIDDLGGEAVVSAQELALVELATRTKLYLDSLDAWLMEQPSLINAKRRIVLPVVLQRQQLADALARYLTTLGLKRRGRKVQDLSHYVAKRYGQGRHGEGGMSLPAVPSAMPQPSLSTARPHAEGTGDASGA